jgi:penicillin-binding protein 1A
MGRSDRGHFFGELPPQQRPAPLKKRRSRVLLLFKAALYASVLGGGVFAGTLLYCSVVYQDPLTLRGAQHPPLVRILARDGAVLSERGGADDYAPLDLLPRHVIDAVLSTEDRRFYSHHGIDPLGLIRAGFTNLRARKFVQGGSTLTQQLAKNLYLTSDRTFARKLEELALAVWLEARLSKSDILELYLNRVYLGSGTYGIDAAARRYFGKPAQKLTLAEAAIIAGLLKAPSKYSPLASPDAATARARLVLAAMLRNGSITADEETAASFAMSSVASGKDRQKSDGAEYALDYIVDQLPEATRTGSDEVIVETTLDKSLQARTAAIVERTLAERGPSLQASQAAVVVLDGDGGVRALVGGASWADSQYNRAVKALRQPGSTFKPFVYLAAIESGLTPDSVIDDAPISVGGWAPRNENGEYRGPTTLRSALARSVNTVAVRLALKVGLARVMAVAKRLGIKSPLTRDASLALGTSEVSLLELTGAYNVLANGGNTAEPHIVRRVFTRGGHVLYARAPTAPVRVVQPAHVAAMNELLNGALVSGTGHRAAFADRAAAGKTGTSQGFRDAWFIGYTAQLTTGVWSGNDDGSAMNHVVGGTLPASIWHDVMAAAHEGKPALALPGATLSAPPIAGPTASGPTAPGPTAVESTQTPPPPGADAIGEALEAPAAHPERPIDADFFARAVDAGPAASSGAAASGAAAAYEMPAGVMSLGRTGE